SEWLSSFHRACKPVNEWLRVSTKRQERGTHQARMAGERPRTRSGAATCMSRMCWAIWAENKALLRVSSGETSAVNRASHPVEKARALRLSVLRPDSDLSQ